MGGGGGIGKGGGTGKGKGRVGAGGGVGTSWTLSVSNVHHWLRRKTDGEGRSERIGLGVEKAMTPQALLQMGSWKTGRYDNVLR